MDERPNTLRTFRIGDLGIWVAKDIDYPDLIGMGVSESKAIGALVHNVADHMLCSEPATVSPWDC